MYVVQKELYVLLHNISENISLLFLLPLFLDLPRRRRLLPRNFLVVFLTLDTTFFVVPVSVSKAQTDKSPAPNKAELTILPLESTSLSTVVVKITIPFPA